MNVRNLSRDLRRWNLALVTLCSLGDASCSKSNTITPGNDCTPGETQPCLGTGDCRGTQACRDDGLGYDACECPEDPRSEGAGTGNGGAEATAGAQNEGGSAGWTGRASGGTGSAADSSGGTERGGEAGESAGAAGSTDGGSPSSDANGGSVASGAGGAPPGNGGTETAGGTDEVAGAGGGAAATGGNSTSCLEAARGWYALRTDGRLLFETRDPQVEEFVRDQSGVALDGVEDAMGGTYHGCARLENGEVWCWRENAARGNWVGQLGNGAIDQDESAALHRASPVLVDVGEPLSDVTKLLPGGSNHDQTCAISREGQLYCWGNLTFLANAGVSLSSSYAIPITKDGLNPLVGVLQASIAHTMGCAIVEGEAENELYCWGANDYQNMGNGETVRVQPYPTRVTSLVSPSRVSVISYNYALNAGGTACVVDEGKIRCWGANSAGQTGTGIASSTVPSPTPVVINTEGTTLLPVPADLIGGGNGFCALSTDRKVWCWGAGHEAYASNYGATNVTSVGSVLGGNWGNKPLYATTDGQYHFFSEWARPITCNEP